MPGRKLALIPSLGSVQITWTRANGDRLVLITTTAAMCVLNAFNFYNEMGKQDLQETTKLSRIQLEKALQLLVKKKILLNTKQVYEINQDFNPKKRKKLTIM